MRQAASVTRPVLPTRGAACTERSCTRSASRSSSGELKPGDPLPPEDELISDLAVSRTVLAGGRARPRREGTRRGAAEDGTRVRARAEWNILDPDVLSWRCGGDERQRTAVRGDDRGAAGDRAARRAAGGNAGDGRRDRRDRGGVRGDGGGRRRPGGVPRCRPPLPRSDPRRVPQRAPRPLGGVLARCSRTTFELTTTPQRSRRRALPLHRAIIDEIAAAERGREPSQATRALIADTAADIKSYRPPRTSVARPSRGSSLERLEARWYGDVDAGPPRASTTEPGETVFPAKPVPVVAGRAGDAPIASARSTASDGVHVADDPPRLSLGIATVDRKQGNDDPRSGSVKAATARP